MQWWDVSVIGRDEPESVQGFHVSPDFFRALGISPHSGAVLPEEEVPGQHLRVVLGQGVWQRRSEDRDIFGRTITLDGELRSRRDRALRFDFPNGTEVWAPLLRARSGCEPRTAAPDGHRPPSRRLTSRRCRAEMSVVGQRLRQQYPEANQIVAFA